MIVAGVISGTSVDGIDVAVLHFDKDFEVLGHHSVPYPPEVREAILAVSNTRTHTGTISRLNFLLGELFADAVKQTFEKLGRPLESLALIGSHGQTIFHEGEPVEYCGYRIASTLQIGEPAVIAKRTGATVIADFRCDDMAAGGKGAPLVPLVDYRLFRHAEIGRIALNIGGIANITVIPAGASIAQVIAFDTGPGNMVMDALMGHALISKDKFDRNGETARRGHVDHPLLETLLADDYYRRPPPKTAGREQYGAAFITSFSALKHEDAVATATELTARTIANAVQAYSGIQEVIVSGGGAHNGFLMERLRQLLPQTVKTSSDYGVDIDAKEAIAFAVLAYESFHGRPGNVPSATGARRAVICGKRAAP
ncbi:MAG: anhydro-N-acetylmuramic acid kinase [Bryobacteraceae bacterium]